MIATAVAQEGGADHNIDTGLGAPVQNEITALTTQIMKDYRQDFRRCVDPALSSDRGGDQSGSLVVSFQLAPGGVVSEVEIQDNTLQVPEVEACLSEVFEEMSFPDLQIETEQTIRFPLVVIY